MLTALKILSALLVMTAPYIWTVGQAGLKTANENICELAKGIAPLPTCEIQYLYVGAWSVGFCAAMALIVWDLAGFVRRAATPHGGVVLFYRHYRSASVQHIKAAWSKLEPTHLIVAGLVIAGTGAVWLLSRPSPADPKIAELQGQLRSAKIETERLRQSQAPRDQSARPSMLTGRPVSGLEIATRLEAVEKELSDTKAQLEAKNQQLAKASSTATINATTIPPAKYNKAQIGKILEAIGIFHSILLRINRTLDDAAGTVDSFAGIVSHEGGPATFLDRMNTFRIMYLSPSTTLADSGS
ncbi:hypothetical protein [Bradyrhizobium lablabi]|uniref:hypothetical protein n=1 Tax=Bradyrhizobium lablabi TaxID=722472 RepID=UPI0009A72B35|nr:hypothetical protein [Bradyrhizobium lablabi]